MKNYKIWLGLLVIVLVLSACNSKEKDSYSFEEVDNPKIEHIHGLGYINGKSDFVIATHRGLYKYGVKGWEEANSQKHDYMGFQAVKDGFYSSGHPEEGSNLKNPLGVIKSTDEGANLEQLAFYGEIDFHYLAAGYDSNTIYVINETPTENMSGGLHYSIDEGKSWTESAMNGFNSEFVSNLSAHPSKKEIVAIGSKDGIFVSNDYGVNFKLLKSTQMVTYVTLNENGGYYTNYDSNSVSLRSFSLDSKEEKNIQLPNEIMQDPIIYIASNPTNREEITFVTNNLNFYLSKNEGESWDKLASEGN